MADHTYGVATDPLDWCRMRSQGLRKLARLNGRKSFEPAPGVMVAGLAREATGLTFFDPGTHDWLDIRGALPRQNLFVEAYTDNPAMLVLVRERECVSGYAGIPKTWVLPRTWPHVRDEVEALRQEERMPRAASEVFLVADPHLPAHPSWLFAAVDNVTWFRWDYDEPAGHDPFPTDPPGPPPSPRSANYRWVMAEYVEHARNVAIMLGRAAMSVEDFRDAFDDADRARMEEFMKDVERKVEP